MEVLLDARHMNVLDKIVFKAVEIDVGHFSITEQVGIFQLPLILEYEIMHFPKFSLAACGLRRFRGSDSMRMQARQRKIPEHETETVTDLSLDGSDDLIGRGAMRTFVITVFDKSDRRLQRAADMVAFCDRQD